MNFESNINFKISDYEESKLNQPVKIYSMVDTPQITPFLVEIAFSNRSYRYVIIQIVIYSNTVDNCIDTIINYFIFGDARTKKEIEDNKAPFSYIDYFKDNDIYEPGLLDKNVLKQYISIYPDQSKEIKTKLRLYVSPKYKMFVLNLKQKNTTYSFIVKTESEKNVLKYVKEHIDKNINDDKTHKYYHLVLNQEILSNAVFYESHFECPKDYEGYGVVFSEIIM